MKMSGMKSGVLYKIVDFDCGANVKRRFFELGFFIDSEVLLLSQSILKHNYLICLDGMIYALNKKYANQIILKLK